MRVSKKVRAVEKEEEEERLGIGTQPSRTRPDSMKAESKTESIQSS